MLVLLGATYLTGSGGGSSADVGTFGLTGTPAAGWDRSEPGLAPAVVGGTTFARIAYTRVRGRPSAAPVAAGSTVVLATETDDVYGVDAATGAVLWHRSLGGADSVGATPCAAQIGPFEGVTGTPVVDPSSSTAYVAARVVGPGGVPAFEVHALDLTRGGAERPGGWPVLVRGSADNDPAAAFDPRNQSQTAGLLLLGGRLYVAFGSGCGLGPYRNWVAGVSTTAVGSVHLWASQANACTAAAPCPTIGQLGPALLADRADSVLVTTAAAPARGSTSRAGPARTVVRLAIGPDGTMHATDNLAPPAADAILLSGVAGMPDSGLVYTVGSHGPLRALQRSSAGDGVQPAVVATASTGGPDTDAAGQGLPVVTSDGTDVGSAVVWAVTRGSGGDRLRAVAGAPQAGVLSELFAGRIGTGVALSTPLTSGGRVFVGAADGASDGALVTFGASQTAVNRDYVVASLTGLEGRPPAPAVVASLTRSPRLSRAALVGAAIRSPAVASARVARTYLDLLRRPPTTSELAAWSGRLQRGESRLSLVAALAQSGVYARANSVAGGPAKLVAAWSRDLAAGAIDQGTRRTLTAAVSHGVSRARVVAEILSGTPARRALVQRAYSDILRRPVDPGGLATYTAYLGAGHSEEQLLLVLLGSPEFDRLARAGSG